MKPSGRRVNVGVNGASVGERAKCSPTGVTVGTWMTNLLVAVAVGRKERDWTIAASPEGVVYAVRIALLAASLLDPCERRPTKLRPAPARVWRLTTVVVSPPASDHDFVSVPKPACSARS